MSTEKQFHELYEVRASDGSPLIDDLAAASARIAELEDWQRRAVDELLDYEGMCEHLMKDGAKKMIRQLIQEATR